MLDHLVDRVFYRIVGCTSSEDIQYLRSVLDLPGLSVCIIERQVTFVRSFSRSFSWAAMLSVVLLIVDAYCQFAILFLLLLLFYYCYYFLCCTSMRIKITIDRVLEYSV